MRRSLGNIVSSDSSDVSIKIQELIKAIAQNRGVP
jgi:hypothetical protein